MSNVQPVSVSIRSAPSCAFARCIACDGSRQGYPPVAKMPIDREPGNLRVVRSGVTETVFAGLAGRIGDRTECFRQ